MIFVSHTKDFDVLTSAKTDLTAPGERGLAQTVLSVLIIV
jgi:hypothetical protein